eukprot:symbB.v1.2.021788.t1/scaffold1903.1/size96501/2
MPILPDTLGSKAFFRTAQNLKIPEGPHKGEPVLNVVGAARQDSGSLEAFATLARSFGFAGGLMASEVEVPANLLEASALGYNTFGAGGFFGDSEKAGKTCGPRELPPVPGADEEVRQELEQPLTDEQAAHGKRPREFGRAGALGAEFSTPASWQGMDQGKEEATSGMKDHELGKAQRSAGMMPMESPEKGDQTEGPHPGGDDEVVDSFQRALEREMLEKLREDNRQLQSELQDLKMQREMEVNSGVASSWSDVSSRPQPPPPPREEEEPQRFTPNGTRIPKGPPPNLDDKVPSWPLGPYEASAVDRVWKHLGPMAVSVGDQPRLHDGRAGHGAGPRHVRDHGDCGQGRGARSRHEQGQHDCRDREEVFGKDVAEERTQTMSEVLTSVQARAFWLEKELESIKGALNSQHRATVSSEYWEKPVHRYGEGGESAPLSRADLGVDRDQAPLGRAERRGGHEQAPLSRATLGECPGDRAFAFRQPAGLGEDREGDVGDGSYHGSRLLHQQLHGVSRGDPEGWNGSGGGRGEQRSPDGLRTTNPTLPKLPMLTSKTASVDMWLEASPLARLRLLAPKPDLGEEMGNPRAVQRLEQRVTTLLMPTLPEELQNDIISNRTLWPAAILYRILRSFQPGGWTERADLLKALTSTTAAGSAAIAASLLRMWKRQRLRATELGASLPDLMIQVQAIEKIASKVLSGSQQSMFRVSSFRMESNIDEKPSETSILQFHELLLAEMDMLATGSIAGGGEAPTLKAMTAGQSSGEKPAVCDKNGGKSFPCKFWGTPSGCRHGKRCSFLHNTLQDQAERCFVCSSLEHRKSSCPYREGPQPSDGSTTSTDQGKNDEGPGDHPPPETSKNAETSGASETLMTEVSSLLKSIRLQGAGPQLRAYCVRSTAYESGNEGWTLLDGGATHCLRRKTSDKEWRESAVVKVQLASEEVEMRLHPVLNTLLVDHPVQQIVPLCKLTEVGWTVRWGHQGCTINHSALGTLPLELQQGCPVVPKEWGDRLMKMVEENESSRFSVRAVIEGRRAPQSGFERDVNELKRLFPGVPDRILERVPGLENVSTEQLPFNRRKRRQLEQASVVVVNLFAGKDVSRWKKFNKKPKVLLSNIPEVVQLDGLYCDTRRLRNGNDVNNPRYEGCPLPAGLAELRKNGGHSLALDEREDDVDGAEEIQSGHPSQEGDDPLQIQEGQEEEDQGLSELEAKAQDVSEKKWKEFIQERKALHVRNITFGVPLKDRSVKEVIKSTSQIYARARAMRLPITRVHTDRAKEWASSAFQQWCLGRDIFHTMTSGDDPLSNSRCEREVGWVKSRTRTLLLATKSSFEVWPLAIRQACEERLRSQVRRMGIEVPELLPFGTAVVVKKKNWHQREDGTGMKWPMKRATLWGPASDMSMSSRAYYVKDDEGRYFRTTVVRQVKWEQEKEEDAKRGEQGTLQSEPIEGATACQSHRCCVKPDDGVDCEVLAEDPFGGEEEKDEVVVEEVERPSRQGPVHDPPKRRLLKKSPPVQTTGAAPMMFKACGVDGSDGEGGEGSGEFLALKQHLWLSEYAQELVGRVAEGNGSDVEVEQVNRIHDETGRLETVLKRYAVKQAKVLEEEVEQQVGQTRLVGMDEVKRNIEEWTEPFREEVEKLLDGALERITDEEFRQLLGGEREVECLPMKAVATVKAGGKKKGRVVVCGNFAEKHEDDVDITASGVDSVTIRTAVSCAVQRGWTMATTDALYGLQQSPSDWGHHRDCKLRELRWSNGDGEFKFQETAERHVWQVVPTTGGEAIGFLLVYVDDLLLLGKRPVLEGALEAVMGLWKCSKPEYLSADKGMRFCGFELWEAEDGVILNQQGYTKSLLEKHGVTGVEQCPLPKLTESEDVEEFGIADLRRAQGVVGELLWLATRSRPDLCFAIGALGRMLHKKPKQAFELSKHVLRYLRGTEKVGLYYTRCKKGDLGEADLQYPRTLSRLDVYSDVSYAPAHESYRSIQGIAAEHAGNLLAWETGRQAIISLSTCEAELISLSEAHQIGDAVGALLKEFNFEVKKLLHNDSKSAISAATSEGGSWRTRHLRLRAHALRQALREDEGFWGIHHLRGEHLLADGLTKPLLGQAFARFMEKLRLLAGGLTEESNKENAPMIDRLWTAGAMVAMISEVVPQLRKCKPALLAAAATLLSCCRRNRKNDVNEKPEVVKPRVCALRWGARGRDRALRSDFGAQGGSGDLHQGEYGDGRALMSGSELHHGGDEDSRAVAYGGGLFHVGSGDSRAWVAEGDLCEEGRSDGYDGHLQGPVRPTRLPTQSTSKARGKAVVGTAGTHEAASGSDRNPQVRQVESDGGVATVSPRMMRPSPVEARLAGQLVVPRLIHEGDPKGTVSVLDVFCKIPKGDDKWPVQWQNLMVKSHGRSRTRAFHPLHRSTPYSLERLGSKRITIIFPTLGGERQVKIDTWSENLPTFQGQWRGFTIFEVNQLEDQHPLRKEESCGSYEIAWSKDGSNISMAIKVLVVHVNGERTSVDPVKTGDPSAGGEGKFEADGLMSLERLEALKARTKVMQEAEAKLSVEEMQSLFETTLQGLL